MNSITNAKLPIGLVVAVVALPDADVAELAEDVALEAAAVALLLH